MTVLRCALLALSLNLRPLPKAWGHPRVRGRQLTACTLSGLGQLAAGCRNAGGATVDGSDGRGGCCGWTPGAGLVILNVWHANSILDSV